MLIPILRYGSCGFDQKTDSQGFVPILPILELNRFTAHNVAKNCLIALAISEKGNPRPRFETNVEQTAIRAIPSKRKLTQHDTNTTIAPSFPKSNQAAPSHQTSILTTSQHDYTNVSPDTPITPPPKIPRYGPVTPTKDAGPSLRDKYKPTDTTSRNILPGLQQVLNQPDQVPPTLPTKVSQDNPTAEEINRAIIFYNEHNPHLTALSLFNATSFDIFEEAFKAGF